MKKFLAIIFLLLCCACSAKYEIKFVDDNVYDNLSVSFSRQGLTDSQVDEFYSNSFYAIGRNKLYSFKNDSTTDNIVINYNYAYASNEFSTANIPNSCFDIFKFFSDDDKYYLFASGVFKCSYQEYVKLDSLDIVIDTNHVVLENNADEVKDNKYIWHVDMNASDFSLRFITKKNVQSNKVNNNYIDKIFIGLGIVGAVTLIITLFILIKNKRVNKI